MEHSDLQKELDVLLAERSFFEFIDGKRCIEWAISLMQRGYESDNLYILAGLDNNDGTSVEYYFEKLTEDLNLTQNRNSEELFDLYTSDIARQVINGRISPQDGLSIMEEIRIQTYEYDFDDNKLLQFLYLAEDISSMDSFQFFYIGLTKENLGEVIIQEMKMHLLIQKRDFKDISNLIYCNRCKSFSQSVYKEKGWFIKKRSWNCERCDSKDYLAWYKVSDREEILAILEKDGNAV